MDVLGGYLWNYCQNDVLKILKEKDPLKHYSININYLHLLEENPSIANDLLKAPHKTLKDCDAVAALTVKLKCKEMLETCRGQDITTNTSPITSKPNVHIRFHSLPVCPELCKHEFPGSKEIDLFMCLSGTVVRTSAPKLLEYSKKYRCSSCKNEIFVEANPGRYHSFPKTLRKCTNSCVNGKVAPVQIEKGSSDEQSKFKDFQEIKFQEHIQRMDFGKIPKSITVVLEDDLVDKCKPGDDATISGFLFLRWKPFKIDQRTECELVFRANHIQVNNVQSASVLVTDEMKQFFADFWKSFERNPFEGKQVILSSFCPQIYGLYAIKLALCVVLAGGVSRELAGSKIRGESHILLVGDPGTGKSQLLKYVSKLIPRAVITTGVGTTTAGLTVAANKEGGEWHLEAGALILADGGGVCCIDEFSCIKEHDRVSVHEAMEQQTISVAKAGMVCKLSTKCTIIAATNPKGKFDSNLSLSMNTALASPLLSRFDLVIILADAENDAWDEMVSNFVLMGEDPLNRQRSYNDGGAMWTTEQLQSYFACIKQLNPIITSEANKVLIEYYQAQRNSEMRDASRTTVRLLESLRRLAEGHARLMYREVVLVQDAVTAISLVEASMLLSALFESPSSLHTTFPADPMEEYRIQAEAICHRLGLEHLYQEELLYLQALKSSFNV